MPRGERRTQARAQAAQRGRARYTVLGRPWPLPVSPVTVALGALFLIGALAVWLLEGRYATPPAEAAKQLIPFDQDQVQRAVVTTAEGSVTFARDPGGQLTPGGTPAVPTPTVAPDAPPPAVQLSPGTKVLGLVGQLHGLQVDRVVLNEPSASADYGLDQPQLTLSLTSKQGQPSTIAVGRLNPDSTAYYVRREQRKDTVLASRYTLEDLLKTANEVIAETRPAG